MKKKTRKKIYVFKVLFNHFKKIYPHDRDKVIFEIVLDILGVKKTTRKKFYKRTIESTINLP